MRSVSEDDTELPVAVKERCKQQFHLALQIWMQLESVEKLRSSQSRMMPGSGTVSVSVSTPAEFTVEDDDDNDDHDDDALKAHVPVTSTSASVPIPETTTTTTTMNNPIEVVDGDDDQKGSEPQKEQEAETETRDNNNSSDGNVNGDAVVVIPTAPVVVVEGINNNNNNNTTTTTDNNNHNNNNTSLLRELDDDEGEGEGGTGVSTSNTSTGVMSADEQKLQRALMICASPIELCASPRWELCGFLGSNPLKDFHSGGLLAAQCMLAFLTKYGDKASLLVLEFVKKRLKYCSLSQVCCQITIFTADALRLLPTPDSPEAPLSLAYIARKHSWTLLNDERCFQEVFDIALLTFDDMWRHYTDQLGHTPTTDTVQLCLFSCRTLLDELVKSLPRNTEQLWHMWTEQRLNRQQALVEAHMRLPHAPGRVRSPSVMDRGAASSSSSNSNNKDDSNSKSLTAKMYCGLMSHVVGGSEILTAHHIDEIEPALPVVHQCCDWILIYKLSRDGASLSTLLRLARLHSSGKNSDTSNPSLLVLRDARGTVFGGFAPETWRDMGERYYGNGTAAVWSFVSGGLQFYPSSQSNSYFMLSSEESLAMGGGGNFSIFLDSDLNHGCSGPCDTYSSPCLASSEQFVCTALELFILRPARFYQE
eukprot:gene1495-2882_t